MMSFKEHLKTAQKTAVFVFGRFNPVSNGHGKLFDKAAEVAKDNDAEFRIYPSHSHDSKMNPLSYYQKVKFIKLAFPQYADNVIEDTANNFLAELHKEGFKKVFLVAGSDRAPELKKLVNKYNGVKKKGKGYNFEGGVKVISAGARDPNSNTLEGISSSKQRTYAVKGDKESFFKNLPADMAEADKESMFKEVRKGLNLGDK